MILSLAAQAKPPWVARSVSSNSAILSTQAIAFKMASGVERPQGSSRRASRVVHQVRRPPRRLP